MMKTSYKTSFTYFHFDIANEQWAVKAIKGGIAEWEQKTCLRFKQRSNERRYLEFFLGSGQGERFLALLIPHFLKERSKLSIIFSIINQSLISFLQCILVLLPLRLNRIRRLNKFNQLFAQKARKQIGILNHSSYFLSNFGSFFLKQNKKK